MARPTLTRPRILAALGIAIVADLIQLPLTAMEATMLFSVPAEAADFILDLIVMGATSFLIGFHILLLPTLFIEVIPGIDVLPTWTGCVAYVIWHRKKERENQTAKTADSGAIIDVEEIKSIDDQHRINKPGP